MPWYFRTLGSWLGVLRQAGFRAAGLARAGSPAGAPPALAARWRHGRSERLCCGSSELPWGLAFEDGLEDGEELAHAGGDGELGGLAAGDEAGLEGADGGLRRMAVRVGMYRALRTLARPPRTMRRPRKVPLSRLTGATPTRLAILRRSRVPGSWQLGDQACAADDLADARRPRRAGPRWRARRAGAHGVFEIVPRISPAAPSAARRGGRRAGGRGVVAKLAAALALAADHLDDLAAAGDQLAEPHAQAASGIGRGSGRTASA